jgi:hypothetical protein
MKLLIISFLVAAAGFAAAIAVLYRSLDSALAKVQW